MAYLYVVTKEQKKRAMTQVTISQEVRAAFEAQNSRRADWTLLDATFGYFASHLGETTLRETVFEKYTHTITEVKVFGSEIWTLGFFGKARRGKKTDWRIPMYESPLWMKALDEVYYKNQPKTSPI